LRIAVSATLRRPWKQLLGHVDPPFGKHADDATRGRNAKGSFGRRGIDAAAADTESDEAAQGPAQQREAEAVLALIRQAQAQDPHARIAVLVRARTHLVAVVGQLRQQGLPFQAVEIEPLGQRQVIQDLLSLTRPDINGAIAHHPTRFCAGS
jgi:superfamily I DNA/RNA helicase